MPKLFVKIGRNLGEDKWEVLLMNATHTYQIDCHSGSNWASPFPATMLDMESIENLITFLQQTLMETQENGESNLERLA